MKQTMKILVTGSNGQLGYELRQLATQFPQGRFVFADIEELDITSSDEVMSFVCLHQPAFIINAAAYTAVDNAEDNPAAARQVNAVAVGHLVKAAFAVNAYLLHISTDYVFDGKKTTPYLETDAVNPLSVYGQTKLEGEHAVQSYKRGLVVRTSWLYSSVGTNFVRTMLRLGCERASVRVVSDQVGSPTYAADLAAALYRIIGQTAEQPALFVPGIFHYANANTCSWYEFAKKIMYWSKCACQVEPCTTDDYPTKARRPAHSMLDCGKIQQTYGVVAPLWENALRRCLKTLNGNPKAAKNENF
jgi:dTDP-4-dehydrorhamnose reductase